MWRAPSWPRAAWDGVPYSGTTFLRNSPRSIWSKYRTKIRCAVLQRIEGGCIHVMSRSISARSYNHVEATETERNPRVSTPLLRVTEGRLMNVQCPGKRNICRFHGQRGTDVDLLFVVLVCDESYEFQHCRGLLLRRLSDEPRRNRHVGTGWATDEIWHICPEFVITLV
jgi:hypothetical protein